MGAHPYQYVVDYQDNAHTALERCDPPANARSR